MTAIFAGSFSHDFAHPNRGTVIIESIVARTLRLPLERPVRTSNLLIEHREFVLVEVRGCDGATKLTGRGFGFTRDGLVTQTVNHNLAPILVGKDAGAIHALWHEMYTTTRYLGRKGVLMRAISAVDIALWDLKGQALRSPLWSILGGAHKRVPAFVAGGYYGPSSEPAAIHEEFSRYRDVGYRGAKLNVGSAGLKTDLERVAAARAAVGDETALMVDFNGSLPNAKEGLRWANALAHYGPAFVEEPFLMDDLPAIREFHARCDLPLAIGEDESGRWAFAELLNPRSLDILRHDATLVGGVSEWLKVAGLGLANRLELFPHWFPEVHIHLALAYPECLGVELIAPEAGIMNFHHLVRNPVTQQDGLATAPDGPGLGLDWDMNAVERAVVA